MSRTAPAPPKPSYPCKWVLDQSGTSIPICMQAQNGPCALLALFNVSLQTRMLTLPPGTTHLPEQVIMTMLADAVSTPSTTSPQAAILRAHAVSDFLDLLPRLNKGMDINVRFSAPTAFEFTRELSAFDIFPNLRLLHGWLVDPQDVRLADALGNLTYNQVIDELVRTTSPAPPPLPDHPGDLHRFHDGAKVDAFEPTAPPPDAFGPRDGAEDEVLLPDESAHTAKIREIRPFVMDFLESNPTQLTVYGLAELHAVLGECETTVLFRNSHFYVVKKFKGELFTLVTDVGYLNELNTVWEKLGDINGDSTFYTGSFQPLTASGTVAGKEVAAYGAAPEGKSQVGAYHSVSYPLARPAQSSGCASQHSMRASSSRAMQQSECSGSRKSAPQKRKSSKNQDCVVQ